MTRRIVSRIVLAFSLMGGMVLVQAALPAGAAGTRYLDEVFPSVSVTSNIVYGQAVNSSGVLQDLTLDLYQPVGDTATSRPLIIWIHGGSFTSGDKASGGMPDHAMYFAKRGYVTASINYRIRPGESWDGTSYQDVVNDPDFLAAVYQAYDDAATSVAWFRSHASDYDIDTDKIVVAGYSAGAVTALNTGSWPRRPHGEGTYSDPRHVTAVVSFAGTTAPGLAEQGEPPVYMAHGTNDTTVAYSEAQSYCTTANSHNVPCEMHPYAGYGHGLPWDTVRADLTPWLYAQVINQPPFIESMSVHSGTTAGGQTVVLTGRGFSDASAVRFGTMPASFVVSSNHQITVTSPPATTPGLVNVRVQDPFGTSPTFNSTLWNYVAAVPPTVTGITPNHGFSSGGESVVITGTNLTGATRVKFGSTPASFVVDSPTQITAAAPAQSPALVNVFVTTAGGTSSAVPWKTWYRFDPGPPVVTGMTPRTGPAAGGTVVTIKGAALTGATSVRFGAVEASSFSVLSDGELQATTPASVPSLVNVFVTTPLGTSSAVTYATWFRFV